MLYYVVPKKIITIKYWDKSFGNYRYKDEMSVEDPIMFDNKDDLFNWFLDNKDGIIPEIGLIEYLDKFKGVSNVIKFTSLSDNVTSYYTKISSLTYKYIKDNKWSLDNTNIDNIYDKFNNKTLKKRR